MQEARRALQLSMRKAAAMVGIDVSYWSRIERGERTPSLELAGRIGQVLKRRPEELFEELAGTDAQTA